ncbi:MAG: iron-containing redox enzyme family protein [Zoogloeaceae bacterium]|nr:iron-containing redox enzyme family protein [Zoogloeaceae bacterium]
MNFHDTLLERTAAERSYLLSAPIFADVAAGRVSLEGYVAFLTEAYHHVKHTVPLLMACGAGLPADRLDWLRTAVAEYIEEEVGHEKWILEDLRACGADLMPVIEGLPSLPTELMVSYVYDRIARTSPVSMFGMVLVLEGTSIALATEAADRIQRALGLPDAAFSYLRSHGSLDLKHMETFRSLMNRLYYPDDREAVVRTAKVVYRLYGDMFRSLPRVREEVAA